MELVIALIVGAGIGYYGRFIQDRLSQKPLLEARQRRSQAGKLAAQKRAQKKVDKVEVPKVNPDIDPSLWGRKVNGSGMADHE